MRLFCAVILLGLISCATERPKHKPDEGDAAGNALPGTLGTSGLVPPVVPDGGPAPDTVATVDASLASDGGDGETAASDPCYDFAVVSCTCEFAPDAPPINCASTKQSTYAGKAGAEGCAAALADPGCDPQNACDKIKVDDCNGLNP